MRYLGFQQGKDRKRQEREGKCFLLWRQEGAAREWGTARGIAQGGCSLRQVGEEEEREEEEVDGRVACRIGGWDCWSRRGLVDGRKWGGGGHEGLVGGVVGRGRREITVDWLGGRPMGYSRLVDNNIRILKKRPREADI